MGAMEAVSLWWASGWGSLGTLTKYTRRISKMRWNMICRVPALSMIVLFGSVAHAGSVQSNDLQVTIVSAYSDGRSILVQTEPRPDITGLTCNNNFWLVLEGSELGFDTIVSFILTAHATGKRVQITAEDNGGSDFCKLTRITLMPQ